MDDGLGPLIIKRAWRTANGRQAWQIAWTTEQLRRIGQAVEAGDETFLAAVEEAIRQALHEALTPQKG